MDFHQHPTRALRAGLIPVLDAMATDQQLEVLRQAAASTLPAEVDSDSPIPVAILLELIDSGYIKAINTSSLDGPAFLVPTITAQGRERLRVLEERARASSVPTRFEKRAAPIVKWVSGIAAVVVGAYLVKHFVS